jgi:hypothetical protein
MSSALTEFYGDIGVGLNDLRPGATEDDIDALWKGVIAKHPDVWATHLDALKAEWYFNRRYTLPHLNRLHTIRNPRQGGSEAVGGVSADSGA